MESINIYCDESSLENANKKYFVLGAISWDRNATKEIRQNLKNILEKYDFHSELKWHNISLGYEKLYKEIIDYVFIDTNISFRAIVVDKEKMDLATYHENDQELAMYKFYYLMLRFFMKSFYKYYIFLDKRNKKDRKRTEVLSHFLKANILNNDIQSEIKHLQEYDSKELLFIQLADFFTGAISFAYEPTQKSDFKKSIMEYIEQKKHSKLSDGSLRTERKFNIFEIQLNREE